MGVRVQLVAAFAVVAACDRSREPAEHDRPPVPAVQPAPDAAVDALDAAAAPADELAVTTSPFKPGTSSIVTFDATLDLDVNIGGLRTITSSKQAKRKKVEILAVDPDGTVHKQITYIKRDTNRIVDGELKKDPSPIRGKTYRVTWKDVITEVRLPSGKPASAEESEAVRADENQLQAPEFLGRTLRGLRLVAGQPFEVPAIALAKLGNGPLHARRLVFTYRGRTPEGARIDAEGELVSDGGFKMYVDLKAELLLDATAWCRQAKVTGQVRAEYAGTVVGSGAGTGLVVATPLR